MQDKAVNLYLKSDRPIYWFLLLWTSLNILQACTLGLHADEAYYWIYSRYLDWGYFDHPPMVALFIRPGDSLIHNELGLRLVNILSSTFSLYLLWRIVKKYNADATWFILVAGGMFTLHIYGFITTPDGPLFLFTVLFFYVYQQYLEKDTWWKAILLGIIIAGLLYSKYHGVLLIGLTLLANIKLLSRWSFWFIVILAAGLYLPHILWQINHHYPSLLYHLSDRSAKVYRFDYTLAYIVSQVLMAGPLIGWMWFYKAAVLKPGDVFTRTLKLNFIGIILFFLATSIRGEVQPQWTIIALAALVILVMISIGSHSPLPVWFKKLAIANLCLIVAVRLLLVAQPDFVKTLEPVKRFFNYEDWAKTIKQKAGNNWLIMDDGFQVPSRYCYYNNTLKCFSYDSRFYRLTQFEIWPMEDSIQGKRAYFLVRRPVTGLTTDTIQTAAGPWYGTWIDEVRTYQKIKIDAHQEKITSAPGKKHLFALTISNLYNYTVNFSNENYKHSVALEACFFEGYNQIEVQKANNDFNTISLQPGQSTKYSFIVTAPAKKGQYDLLFSIHTLPFDGSKNSRVISFKVE
ncbi:MAG: hypothetical protein EOP47_22610 [Sphingobacteriaceae bacterium]|nr:MAG: hypothetical protein EOP47_22610 [Sphingobacteriaceae bacterium]